MRLYGEMLAEDLGDPRRRREYATRISAEAERLGRVVSNVLGYTRLERGHLAVQPRPGDLAAAVAGAVERLRPTLASHGARLELSVEGELPEVCFDPDAVHQIVQNLVDNAEKYTRQAEDRRVDVGLRGRGEAVELQVRDHGAGVAEPVRRHLFEPFVRGETGEAPGGLGLGLVLVRTLATAHGGDVRYESAPGGGALFCVTFPAAAGA